MYYENKMDSLKQIFATDEICLKKDALVVRSGAYSIVDYTAAE